MVTMTAGYQVSLNRFDYIDLNETYILSSNLIVLNKGNCVKVNNGRSCTGSSLIVVQKGFKKPYSMREVNESELFGIRNVTSCCREVIGDKSNVFGMLPEFRPVPYHFKNSPKRRRRQAVDRNNGQMFTESECSCPC